MARKIITPEQLEAIAAAHTRRPASAGSLPAGAAQHLSEEEFIGYAQETLTPAQQAAVTAHLELCAECSERMDHLVTVALAWEGASGQRRLKALSDRLLHVEPGMLEFLIQKLKGYSLRSNVSLAGALGKAEPAWPSGESEEGLLSWSFEHQPEQEQTLVHFSSFLLPAQTRIRLYAGQWEQVVTLVPVSPDQVGASAALSDAARVTLDAGTPLQFELLEIPA